MLLCAASVGVLCCFASGPHVDEAQIRSQAASEMSCEEALLHLENDSSSDRVARYVVRGCGQTRTYDCVEVPDEGGRTACKNPFVEGSDGATDDSGLQLSSGGCGCGHLFGHHAKSEASPSSSSPNVTSHTPQTKRPER
jgi:hypothetical protein